MPGLTLPKLAADLTISSHGHGDHFYPEGVALSGKKLSIGLLAVDGLAAFTSLFPVEAVRYLDEPVLHIDREIAPGAVVFPWPTVG